MFDIESFEKELDDQNAALESMLAELDSIECSSENSLLDKVQAQVDAKCTTTEACESMLAKLNNEIREYNEALQTMKVAAESYGVDGDKDALRSAITPASDIIRSKYSMITMESSSEGTVTDDEVESVRDFLIGSRAIIETKMEDLRTANESDAPEIPETDVPDETPVTDTDETSENSTVESFINSVDSFDVATEGLKESLKNAKDRFVTWIKKIIAKFTKKEKDEKDPKKKGALSKLLSKLKSLFSNGQSAETIEDVQDAKSEAEKALDEVDAIYSDALDSQYDDANESALIEIAHKELELALESYSIAEEAYFESVNEDVEIYTDEYVATTESYYNALACDNMEVATEAFAKLKASLANVCEKLANKCFAMYTKANEKNRAKAAKKNGTNLTSVKQKCNAIKSLGNWFKAKAAKLRGNISEAEFESAQKEVDAKKAEMEKDLDEINKFYEGAVYADQYDDKPEVKPATASFIDENANPDEVAVESFDEFIDVVTESLGSVERQRIFRMKYGESKKAINATIKEAKAAAKSGDYRKAISLYKKAKSGFNKLKSLASKLPDTRYNSTNMATLQTDTKEISSSRKNKAINWCNTQISKCDLAIQKLQDKIAKSNRKADAKAAKEAAKAAKESFTDDELLSELDSVVESLTSVDELDIDDLDEILGEEV